MPNGGNLKIEARRKRSEIEIKITDDGIGIPADKTTASLNRSIPKAAIPPAAAVQAWGCPSSNRLSKTSARQSK